MAYRDTTRIGPCGHCRRVTVQACQGCNRFVCERCTAVHDAEHGRPPAGAPAPR